MTTTIGIILCLAVILFAVFASVRRPASTTSQDAPETPVQPLARSERPKQRPDPSAADRERVAREYPRVAARVQKRLFAEPDTYPALTDGEVVDAEVTDLGGLLGSGR